MPGEFGAKVAFFLVIPILLFSCCYGTITTLDRDVALISKDMFITAEAQLMFSSALRLLEYVNLSK
jgi:hypothetical protein